MEQLKTIGRELAMVSQGGFGQSKEFLDIVKSVGEARSKDEEDQIVVNEIETLKRRLLEPNVTRRMMREYILRLLYVEMLGHDASFGYIHALKMTHDDNLLHKRTGYLAVSLFLNEDHDLIILIVNTIQKDLKSDNYLVVCSALHAVSKLINEDTIPAILPQLVELLGHQKESIRKKAIMALHRFYRKAPSSVSHLVSNFRKRLCDNDPGVVGATLYPLFDLISVDVSSFKDLVISFVSILKQVIERRLPKTYDYNQMPAPFIQIKLLKILALLGNGDKHASESMFTVLEDLFRKCNPLTNIGNAVLYESLCCVSSIFPNPKLLEAAADVISRFLKSNNHNLKYMGIDGLGRLIKISPGMAEQHQLAVIDCLEDSDDTLKRKTFELLYKMTNPSNVEVIVDRMIEYMISINDNHYKTEIATRCVELAEQFAPSNKWFIQTMNKVFEQAGDLVNIKLAHNLMHLIADGFGEDDDAADSMRSSAVESYLRIISEPKLPSVFLQVICWVLGEYGMADGKYSASYISGKLCDVAEAYSDDEIVKGYAVTALTRIYEYEIASGRRVDIIPEALIEELQASHSTDLQQRAYELQAVVGLGPQAVQCILDTSYGDLEVDKNLEFLNGYIQHAIEKGAQPYLPNSERTPTFSTSNSHTQDHLDASSHGLRFEAYELSKPSLPSMTRSVPSATSTELISASEASYSSETHQSTPISALSEAGTSAIKLRLDGVQRKWGRPTCPSSVSESSNPDSSSQQQAVQGTTGVGYASSEEQTFEIDPEKQRLAASLFGGSTRSERRSFGGCKTRKGSAQATKNTLSSAAEKPAPTPPPTDLLVLDEPSLARMEPLVDPFARLEDLVDNTQGAPTDETHHSSATTNTPDIIGLYTETPAGISDIDSLLSGLPYPGTSSEGTIQVQSSQHLIDLLP